MRRKLDPRFSWRTARLIADLPVKAERLFVDGLTHGTAIAAETGVLHFVGPDGQIFTLLPRGCKSQVPRAPRQPWARRHRRSPDEPGLGTLNVSRDQHFRGHLCRRPRLTFCLQMTGRRRSRRQDLCKICCNSGFSAFYVVGELKSKNEDKVRRAPRAWISMVSRSRWRGYEPSCPRRARAQVVMVRRRRRRSPAYEVLVTDEDYFVRLGAADGAMHHITAWELPNADGKRIAYDGVSDDINA